MCPFGHVLHRGSAAVRCRTLHGGDPDRRYGLHPDEALDDQATSSVTDCRASTTAALTVTSVVFEGNQIPLFGFASRQCRSTTRPVPDYNNDPIRLATGEGLAIRNVVIWPAAGTGVLTAMVSWVDR